MTRRGARLVLLAAGLAWAAAALSFLAPRLPEGLAAASAPDLVARELLAALAALALLGVPSVVADDRSRRPEDHTALLTAHAAAPAAVALPAAGGGAPAALLPAAALVLACDLAASSYLRLDPAGGRGVLYAAAAAALLAGLPVAAYGVAEFGGGQWAAAAFRLSPLLAVRDVAGGWEAVGPAALLLVAAAAVLRLAALRTRGAAVAVIAAAALLPASPGARAAEGAGNATVLAVGAPREGDYATLAAALRSRGLRVEEREALAWPLPGEVRVVLITRDPGSGEGLARRLRALPAAGVDVVLWPGAKDRLGIVDGALGAWAYPGEPGLAEALAAPRVAVPHPADRADRGVAPSLFRIPFPVGARSLPGRTLAFLGVLALASAAAVLVARRRGFGPARSGLSLGGVSAVGSCLLFLPGVLGDPVRIHRLVLEERREGAPTARRVEILRLERLSPGGPDRLAIPGAREGSWEEIRYSADSPAHGHPALVVRVDVPGQYALYAGVSGVESPPAAGPPLVSLLVRGDRAWRAAGEGPGEPLADALSALRRDPDPRVSLGGALLAECFRPPAGSGPFRLEIPAGGPEAVVIHLAR